MPGIDDINTSVYGALAGHPPLTGLCTVYKGGKRPAGAANPSATVEARRLERGQGDGIWMCDIAVTVYADMLGIEAPDHETHAAIARIVRSLLADRTIDIDGGQAMPLIEGECGSPEWDGDHEGETRQELVYGLVFVKFS